jgi:hypothetical protein
MRMNLNDDILHLPFVSDPPYRIRRFKTAQPILFAAGFVLAMGLFCQASQAASSKAEHKSTSPDTPRPTNHSIGPDLEDAGCRLMDRCPQGSVWEDNGYPDPGETVDLYPSIRNDGDATATGVSGVLASTNPLIKVLTAQTSYPNIRPGKTVEPNAPFRIYLDPTLNCPFTEDLNLQLQDQSAAHAVKANVFNFGMENYYIKELEIWPPYHWAIVDNGGCGAWQSSQFQNSNRGAEADTRGCAGPTHAEMRTPILDLSQTEGHWLIYDCNFDTGGTFATAYTEISTDGGWTWAPIQVEFSGDSGWHEVQIDISAYKSGPASFRFRLENAGGGADWRVLRFLFDDIIYPARTTGSSCGACSSSAPCMVPSDPLLGEPLDGASDLSSNVFLDWSSSENAVYYEVWMGRSSTDMTLLGTTATPVFSALNLEPGTQYYWMISARNECAFVHSRIWSFTTASDNVNSHGRPVSPP